jgi:vesicle-associated membrane protein 7
MPIIYAVVARPDTVLAEYSATAGNFSSVTQRILAKIVVSSPQRQAYAYDRHVFNYVVGENGLVFLCMTDESFEKRLAFAFLDDIKRRWSVAFANRGATAARFAMNDEFSRVLQKQMEFYASGDPAADKLGAINKNVEEVKGIMVSNIEKVLDRQEKIELLVDKTDKLNEAGFKFKKSSTALKRQMCLKNAKITAAIVFVVLVVILIIVMSVCGAKFECAGGGNAATTTTTTTTTLTSAISTLAATTATTK